jgi:prevent-host-death family protein
MAPILRLDAEEALNQLPRLLDAAERGETTVITKHGKPVAALVPIKKLNVTTKQMSLLSLQGSGRGLWGPDSTKTIDEMRDEWER